MNRLAVIGTVIALAIAGGAIWWFSTGNEEVSSDVAAPEITTTTAADSPTTTEMLDVVVVKIHLLVRDLSQDPNYKNTNTYQLGNKTSVTFNDNFHRAVFSTTVVSQNQRFLAIR